LQTKVTIDAQGPSLDRSQSYRELSRLDTDAKGPADRRGATTFGLTGANISLKSDFKGGQIVQPGGVICGWVTAVQVVVLWQEHVRVASEIVPDSCQDRAVREHEAKHVSLDRALRSTLQRQLTETLQAKDRFSVMAGNVDEVRAKLQSNYTAILQQAVQAFEQTRNPQQIAIDSPQEYARVMAVCGRGSFEALVHS